MEQSTLDYVTLLDLLGISDVQDGPNLYCSLNSQFRVGEFGDRLWAIDLLL